MRAAALAVLLAVAGSAAGADTSAGRKLHDAQCVACHVSQFGGDGTGAYLRPERKVKSLEGLRQRVAVCNTFAKAGWFPDEEEQVSAYLAERFYRFK